MDLYKEKNQSDGSLDKLKLIVVVRGDLHNEELVGDNWSPTASTRTLKYFSVIFCQEQVKIASVIFYWSILTGKG